MEDMYYFVWSDGIMSTDMFWNMVMLVTPNLLFTVDRKPPYPDTLNFWHIS